jgi:hypothetical protein
VSFVKDDFEELEEVVFSLREVFPRVKSTTFPIENHTIRMKFPNVYHHLFRCFILRVSLISFNKVFYVSG